MLLKISNFINWLINKLSSLENKLKNYSFQLSKNIEPEDVNFEKVCDYIKILKFDDYLDLIEEHSGMYLKRIYKIDCLQKEKLKKQETKGLI